MTVDHSVFVTVNTILSPLREKFAKAKQSTSKLRLLLSLFNFAVRNDKNPVTVMYAITKVLYASWDAILLLSLFNFAVRNDKNPVTVMYAITKVLYGSWDAINHKVFDSI